MATTHSPSAAAVDDESSSSTSPSFRRSLTPSLIDALTDAGITSLNPSVVDAIEDVINQGNNDPPTSASRSTGWWCKYEWPLRIHFPFAIFLYHFETNHVAYVCNNIYGSKVIDQNIT